MRIVVVTSEANFVQDNYAHLLRELLAEYEDEIAALVVVRTVSLGLGAKIAGLYAMGVREIAKILLQNSLRATFGRPFASFERAGIPCIVTDDINSQATLRQIEDCQPDLVINARTRAIFGAELLDLARLGCINIHHGVLPRYRGTMCDLWALYEGRNPGFSIHEMTAKIDEGDILHVHEHHDWDSKEYFQLPYRSSFVEAKALIETIEDIDRAGEINGRPNESDDVVYTRDPTWKQIQAMRNEGLIL